MTAGQSLSKLYGVPAEKVPAGRALLHSGNVA